MPIDQARDALPQPCPSTDGQLLECFITHGDEAAFEALVRRHGPMVLGVCRRVLRHPQDAEDAFQATFLVLIRKAAAIGQRERLGNWLYGVAYRTALDARAAALRRQKRERQVSPMPDPPARDEASAGLDLRPLLDQELNRLPDKYRLPVVLCDLEGRTYRDVAQQLGIPAGTLSGRLTTARGMLAQRLTRRGLVVSAGALAAALSPSAASAAVPAPLVASTVAVATGQAAGGATSAQAVALAEGVVKAMLVKKLKIGAAVLTAVVGAAALVAQADWRVAGPGAPKVLDLGDGQRGRRVVWSPDGKTLVVVTIVEKAIFGIQYDRRGSAIRLWDVEKGRMRHTLAEDPGKGLAFQQVVFSPDGKTIAATVDGFREVVLPNGGRELRLRAEVKIWDAKTLALKQTLAAGSQLVGLALSPDGKLAAGGDPSAKAIKLWDIGTGKLQRTLETGAQPWPLMFSPDGKVLAVGCQNADQVQLWDTQTWKLKHVLKQDKYVNSVAFSKDSKIVAIGSGGDSVQLWDVQKKEVRSLKGVESGARSVAFSPDGQTVAAGWTDGKVRLWDVRSGELKETLKGHSSAIYSLAFSPNGKTLASTGQDETVRLWSIKQRAAGPKQRP